MVIEQAKEVLKIEAQSILSLVDRVGVEFEKAAELIMGAKGRVVLTGMGKSGLVARKIAATFNSTGTPSQFLHPGDAIHGDLGMVTRDDIVLAISNSGQTDEINTILPMLRRIGAKVIGFTGAIDSPMAAMCDIIIDVGVEREACPMGMAPTASTTAALAMGDALAVTLINLRRFNQVDFKKFHPGGSLGERLATKIKDVMLTDKHIPMIPIRSKVQQAIEEINRNNVGATLIVERGRKLAGIVSDADLRKALIRHGNITSMWVKDIMSTAPRTIGEDQTVSEAFALMETYNTVHLVVVDRRNRVEGFVHLQDLLGREVLKANELFKSTTRSNR